MSTTAPMPPAGAAPAAAAEATPDAGTRIRGKNWTEEELNALLNLVEQLLPRNASGWAAVHAAYTRAAPPAFAPRDAIGMRRKFSVLRNSGGAAGEALCPPEVARAKRLHRLIKARTRGAPARDDGAADADDRETGESSREDTPPLQLQTSLARIESPRTPVFARSPGTSARAPVAVATPPLVVPSRVELTPGTLSRTGATPDAVGALSALAEMRSTIDRLVEQIESGSSNNNNSNSVPSEFTRLILEMEERAAAREMRYRRERDEEERRREAQRRQDRLERQREQEKREQAREEREQKRDELFEALLVRLLEREEQAGN